MANRISRMSKVMTPVVLATVATLAGVASPASAAGLATGVGPGTAIDSGDARVMGGPSWEHFDLTGQTGTTAPGS